MSRVLSLVVLAALAAAASAQPVSDGPYYNSLDEPHRADARPGVRVGVGVGASAYSGPSFDRLGFQVSDNVLATNLAVTGEVSFPLSGPLYGRVTGGLANIGADGDSNGDGFDDSRFNPFVTSETVLAEANLLYYLTSPRARGLSPYVFSGLSGLFATGDAAPGVPTAALAVPVGLGVEFGLSRNLSLYAEGSYRFGLTDIGPDAGVVGGSAAATRGPDVCDGTSTNYDREACKAKNEAPYCTNGGDPDQACRQASSSQASEDRGRFNSGLIIGGLRLGFGRAPAPPAVPAYVPPVAVTEAPAPVVLPAAPEVCDIVELNPVSFDYGTGTLDRRARSLLDENVGQLLGNPACCVFVDGFTDTPEGDRFGQGLAGRRAQAVYDYYLSRGVDASRLQVRNRGVAVPNCDKEDPGPGCERNRRVESLPVDCERFRFLLENPSYDPY